MSFLATHHLPRSKTTLAFSSASKDKRCASSSWIMRVKSASLSSAPLGSARLPWIPLLLNWARVGMLPGNRFCRGVFLLCLADAFGDVEMTGCGLPKTEAMKLPLGRSRVVILVIMRET